MSGGEKGREKERHKKKGSEEEREGKTREQRTAEKLAVTL